VPGEDNRVCLYKSKGQPQLVLGKERSFTFDHVFDQKSTQVQVHSSCVTPLIDAVFQGFNATVFAYGQTGSGKTFSMLGAEGGRCPSKLDGIVPKLCAELFRRFASQTRQGEREYQIHATYVEIFAHRVYDLLAPNVKGVPAGGRALPELSLRESSDGDRFEVGVRVRVR
jgi:kinesin family protein 4/21/27